MMIRLKEGKGFTLVELLIVVAIIGILVLVVLPLLYDAVQRGKQKRTMHDMRTIATGLEAYMVDYNIYPDNIIAIEPYYVSMTPRKDGWGRQWIYDTFEGSQSYSISSGGRDGGGHATALGVTNDFDDSITMVNGRFYSYPAGQQHQ